MGETPNRPKEFYFDDKARNHEYEFNVDPGDDSVGQGSARTVLGGGKVAKRVTSLQVRLFTPNLGVFKGILAQKRGIEHVQLPPSMRKVPPKVTNREAAQFAARNGI
jgi:hypothetical protein